MSMILAPTLINAMKTYGIKYAALFSGTANWLNNTFGAPTDQRIATFSFWTQRHAIDGTYQTIFVDDANGPALRYENSERFSVNVNEGATNKLNITNAYCRDASGFMHVCIAIDTTAASGSRLKIYFNGVQQTLSATDENTQDYPLRLLQAGAKKIGLYASGVQVFNGALAEFYFIDGQALGPSDFAKMDFKTGNWIAKKYTGTYGANGFYLDFSNSGAIGTDA
ncbi:MAG: hypothetical protein HQL35_11530, partial [Alphaproteobacteria bacterium]|nr:hypothetical protein [Alphaproteobacteria bacterium]